MTPPDAIAFLAAGNDHLGAAHAYARDLDRALHYWREAIRLHEAEANLYDAAVARRNIALALAANGSPVDARQYAEAALRGFQTCGSGAAAEVQETLALISEIAKATTA
jgi:hypothetical protein